MRRCMAQRRVDTEEMKQRAKVRAKVEADKQADVLRSRLGELAVEAAQEYFPEQYQRRRRQDMVKAFAAGIAVGVLSRWAVKRRR